MGYKGRRGGRGGGLGGDFDIYILFKPVPAVVHSQQADKMGKR